MRLHLAALAAAALLAATLGGCAPAYDRAYDGYGYGAAERAYGGAYPYGYPSATRHRDSRLFLHTLEPRHEVVRKGRHHRDRARGKRRHGDHGRSHRAWRDRDDRHGHRTERRRRHHDDGARHRDRGDRWSRDRDRARDRDRVTDRDRARHRDRGRARDRDDDRDRVRNERTRRPERHERVRRERRRPEGAADAGRPVPGTGTRRSERLRDEDREARLGPRHAVMQDRRRLERPAGPRQQSQR